MLPVYPPKGPFLLPKIFVYLSAKSKPWKGSRQNYPLQVLRKWSPITSIRDRLDALGLKICLNVQSHLAWGHWFPWQTKPGHTGLVRGKGMVSPGKRHGVPRIVENKQAFFCGIKGWRSAGQLEATARALWFFTGFLVGRRIALGCLALDDCNGRSWWLENDQNSRGVWDPHGKQALEVACHVLDDGSCLLQICGVQLGRWASVLKHVDILEAGCKL